ncbi:MAG: hypothetical protein ACOYX5_18345 [Actinomycetota bacterium]
MTTPLPTPKAVRDLLLDLLGRNVEVAIGDAYAPKPKEPATLAVFVDDGLRTRAVIALDLDLSAYAAAAIGLIPVGGAEAAIEDAELSPLLQENLGEVLNICGSLLNAEGHPHVKLHATYPPGAATPSDVPGFAAILGNRLDLVVDVTGYGKGKLSIVGAP